MTTTRHPGEKAIEHIDWPEAPQMWMPDAGVPRHGR